MAPFISKFSKIITTTATAEENDFKTSAKSSLLPARLWAFFTLCTQCSLWSLNSVLQGFKCLLDMDSIKNCYMLFYFIKEKSGCGSITPSHSRSKQTYLKVSSKICPWSGGPPDCNGENKTGHPTPTTLCALKQLKCTLFPKGFLLSHTPLLGSVWLSKDSPLFHL